MSTKVNNDGTPSKAKARRLRLIQLSNAAKKLRDSYDLDGTVNEIILEHFYKNEEHQTFAKLPEWNREGYRIKKGSQAFVVWGRPKKLKDKEGESESNPEQEESGKEYYPMAYLFSNAQVERREK